MKRIRILPGVILIVLAGLIPALSQETPRTSSAVNSAATVRATSGGNDIPATRATDDVCDRRLLKALDALDKAERVIAALEAEIAARKRLDAVNEEILAAKTAVIAEQAKMIDLLKKQTGRKVSLFFGLVRIRY